MSTAAASLANLAEQLAKKQSELQDIRRAFDSHLADLQRRKQDLEATLRQVEAEILGTIPPASPLSPPVAASKPAATPRSTPAADSKPTLNQMVLQVLQGAGRSLTVKEVTDELVKLNYSSSSGNLAKMVRNRIDDMVKKQQLRRRETKAGIVLSPPRAAVSAAPAKSPAVSKPTTNGSAARTPSKAPGVAQPRPNSLRALLHNLLTKASRPLKAQELAVKVLATGYQTKSKTFVDVVWTALSQMDGVENVSGQGYRLTSRARKSS